MKRNNSGGRAWFGAWMAIVVLALGLTASAVAAVVADGKARAVQAAEGRMADWSRHIGDLKKERAGLATDSEPYRVLDAHIGRLEEDLAVVNAITQRLREADDSDSVVVARRLDGRFASLEATAAARPGVR